MLVPSNPRKVFQGVATRHEMYRLFDRQAQRPNRWHGCSSSLYTGEWFEIAEADYQMMLEILPPLWMRGGMFARQGPVPDRLIRHHGHRRQRTTPLKALHHLDVPWLPSQIEQREGRIVRQGNQHSEVELFAYATEGSLDATMWQNNERKARFIAAALSGDTSIRRLDDLGEGQANQFAMAKAIASGDQRLMQKAGLEADIARLERLRAAHRDDQHAVRRQIRDAERDIDTATRRIAEIGEDIARRVPTTGDAFQMVVTGETHHERKMAGRALMKEILTLIQLQKRGSIIIATIGGFDLIFEGQGFGRGEGYRYTTMLRRTGEFHEIDLAPTITPLGAIARLKHTLSGFEDERDRYRQRLDDARRRLASYQSRQDGEFAFAGELSDKRRQLVEIEHALASDVPDDQTIAA